MANKAVLSKQQILDAAYELADSEGLGALSVRGLATFCGISVGSVYNYFPTKADLVSDVIGRFWRQALPHDIFDVQAGETFISFSERLFARLSVSFTVFRKTWLAQMATLDSKSHAAAREREESCFAHICRGLQMVLENDRSIDSSRLTGPLAPEVLSRFVWDAMISSLRKGSGSCDTLFELLSVALYRDGDVSAPCEISLVPEETKSAS